MSVVTSTVPVFAARSSVTEPLDLSNLPRQTDTPPMWSASKLGYVWLGSNWYVTLSAKAENDSDAASAPAAIIQCFFNSLSLERKGSSVA
ncbi:MAG: hypothetical protein GAK33_01205 [Burkholderia lata]|uniref:Uncharacterized protein n=1 Tax=Burkholderia lata (strain ATCC 17760 / DSM 23089 / LMG 22485 / NCIMB 9086 / R18194 / 383) TaxID=482957 RepID=A0A833PZ29_BURL3|nr:MAG: hypothetical protein GAK33_01205 [Burkholderia lata]